MDEVQDILFGQAPRRVGTPVQHWVWSTDQFDFFIGSVNGRRNVYSTSCWWDFAEDAKVTDRVLYDLDSPAKDENGDWRMFDGDPPDDVVIERMRSEPEIAEAILGDVCDDARKLARRSRDDNVPVVGVFSGFGLHIHQLFEPTVNPATAMATTADAYVDRLDLQTPDLSILGQPERICRVPNCERVADSVTSGNFGPEVQDGRSTGLYTVPLSRPELCTVDPDWLLDHCASPRVPVDVDVAQRPEMQVWTEYKSSSAEGSDVPPRPLHPEETNIADDDGLRQILQRLLRMPCMVQRLLDDPNPDHDVRINATVMLFNVGLTPPEVVELYDRINWVDFDRQKTEKYVRGLWKNPVSDMRCETLISRRLCVVEDKQECPTYGWSGGQPEWTS